MLDHDMLVRLKIDFSKWGKYKFSDLMEAGEAKSDGQCIGSYMYKTEIGTRLVCFLGAAALGATGLTFDEFYIIYTEEGLNIQATIEGAIGKQLFQKFTSLPASSFYTIFDTAAKLNDDAGRSLREGAEVFRLCGL